jgi:hypothetical protein
MTENYIKYEPLSQDEIHRKVEEYMAIAEGFLSISRDEMKRKTILEEVIEKNKKDWIIDPDF